jgi:hypothetical protein
MENQIIAVLQDKGPMNGAMLVQHTCLDVLSHWQACRKSENIQMEVVGQRYLRLDRNVEGYARLSPSIRREFLTYTFVGLGKQAGELKRAAKAFGNETDRICREKEDVARQSVVATVGILPEKEKILSGACFILAGDVVYGMAHTVSRPEKSTGEMVRGSDLDIIIVTEDSLNQDIVQSLDNYIHKRKHLLLVNEREELDYLIKTVSRVREQLRFDQFSSMVAAKILHEGQFLYGNMGLFQKVKALLGEYGIPEKLTELERSAIDNREIAEAQLLEIDPETESSEYFNLFYTHAEEDEIY